MKGFALAATALVCLATNAVAADNGLVSKRSKYTVAETLNRLESVAKAKGLTVFLRVDHSGDAEKVGQKLRPTQLLILGNPKGGTPVMQSAQTAAIDLPLKALAWEDDGGKVWLSYNSSSYLQQRHGFAAELAKNVGAIAGLVDQALE